MRTVLSLSGVSGVASCIGLAALLLTAVAGYAGSRGQPVRPSPDPDAFRISVDVPLVVLHATVSDRQDTVVTDLRQQDFEIYENRVSQRIQVFQNEDIPVTVGLVIDHSSTMRPKITEVTAAARTFARFSNPEDEIFVVNFHEIASLGLPIGIRFTHNIAALQDAMMTAPTGGQTALYDAIAMGLRELQAGSRDKKVLIVVSDGGDNVSKLGLEQVMKLVEQSSAVIYTVGLFDEQDPDRNPSVLKLLARATGGEAFLPGQVGEVVAICERIARDIRHQYTFGYAPSNPARDGSYRAIRVLARAKGHDRLSVRTRTGYIAGATGLQ